MKSSRTLRVLLSLTSQTMLRPPSIRRSLVLLAATVIWLIAVTLCSTGAMAASAHTHDGDHSDTGHEHHSSAPSSTHDEADCGCESFNAFPAQPATPDLGKIPAPAPGGEFFLSAWSIPFSFEPCPAASLIQSTSPPQRLSFAELVLQRCLLSHAPPSLTI